MELKEAIEKFKNKRNELQEDVNRVEDYVNTLEDEEWIEAIDIVLEELEGLQKENDNLRIALKSEEIISEDMPPETEFIIMTKANYLRNYKKKE